MNGITHRNEAASVSHAMTARGNSVSAAATTSTSSAGSDITSTDFLSLLVSELKNQDPTQPTDPTAYVQQLVSVNSLQQLIEINQDLKPLSTSSSATTISNPASAV